MNNLETAQKLIKSIDFVDDLNIYPQLLALKPKCEIIKTDAASINGRYLYAIQIIGTKYWFEAFPYLTQATNWCKCKGIEFVWKSSK